MQILFLKLTCICVCLSVLPGHKCF